MSDEDWRLITDPARFDILVTVAGTLAWLGVFLLLYWIREKWTQRKNN